ncbi:MAG: type II toxin-antitoxin system RelB/DinJ family antitoxin [Oscillospiraceae bacterium]|jgi:DNA-damage-inducible protein J|nr:type II toxin-antitoxin system RelB/DinJ family antitoxin [Oscillospiraceae bacterium]
MAAQARSALIQVKLDEDIKTKADALFAELGLDTPTAIRIFLNQAISREGLPFEVAKPQYNAETLATLLEEQEIRPKRYNNFDEILAEVRAEIEAEESDEIQD